MTTSETRYRYRALDTYRFMAASGVVLYHFENHFRPFLPAGTHLFERFHLLVDFFFVLSGFVMAHTYGARVASVRDYLTFLRKRLARVYPLHVLTIVLFCGAGVAAVASGIPVRDRSFFDPSLVPANLLLVQAWGVTDRAGLNIPSWSISAEWFVYLLFPLFALFVRRYGAGLALLAALGSAVTTDQLRAAFGLGPAEFATFDFGNFRAVPSFLAGMAVFALVDRAPHRRLPWAIPHGFTALLLLLLLLLQAPTGAILLAFPLLVALVALAERGGAPTVLASRVGVQLGHASFAIYMIHTFFQVGAVILAHKLGWTNPPQLIAIALVTYGLIVIASLVSFSWFEEPLRRALSRDRRRSSDGVLVASSH